MREQDFHMRLLGSTFAALRFAERYVTNRLALSVEYVVALNSSYDENRLGDEVIYPDDDDRFVSGLDDKGVVELLYRDGRCPQWIDVSVRGASEAKTLVNLTCCGRYNADDTQLYYYKAGTQPFCIKSPVFPPEYLEDQPFQLMSVELGVQAACWKPGQDIIEWEPYPHRAS